MLLPLQVEQILSERIKEIKADYTEEWQEEMVGDPSNTTHYLASPRVSTM